MHYLGKCRTTGLKVHVVNFPYEKCHFIQRENGDYLEDPYWHALFVMPQSYDWTSTIKQARWFARVEYAIKTWKSLLARPTHWSVEGF